jgi:hypothetical protein
LDTWGVEVAVTQSKSIFNHSQRRPRGKAEGSSIYTGTVDRPHLYRVERGEESRLLKSLRACLCVHVFFRVALWEHLYRVVKL